MNVRIEELGYELRPHGKGATYWQPASRSHGAPVRNRRAGMSNSRLLARGWTRPRSVDTNREQWEKAKALPNSGQIAPGSLCQVAEAKWTDIVGAAPGFA